MNGTLVAVSSAATRAACDCRPRVRTTQAIRGTHSQPARANGKRADQLDSPNSLKLSGRDVRLQPRDLKIDAVDAGVRAHDGGEAVRPRADHRHAVMQAPISARSAVCASSCQR